MLEVVREADALGSNARLVRSFVASTAIQGSVMPQPNHEEIQIVHFDNPLGSEEVTSLLSVPLSEFVPDFNDTNVQRSVRSSAIPNSRISRSAYMFGQEAVDNLKGMQQDLFGLADVMGGPVATEAVTMQVYTEDDVSLMARESLLNKSLKELSEICDSLGIAADEISLMRSLNNQRHGRRQMRMYDLDDAGIDSELLRQTVINNEYYRKMVRRGDSLEAILLAHSQSPGKDELSTSGVELGKIIPPEVVYDEYGNEDPSDIPMGDRRQVTFHRKDRINHLAVPLVRWRQPIRGSASSVAKLDRKQRPRLDISGSSMSRTLFFGHFCEC